jgi:hypothetical protein
MAQRTIWTITLMILAACVTAPEIDPGTKMEIATIASKVCTDRFGPKADFAINNWRVRADRDMWLAETPNRRSCRYGVYILMVDKTPDFLGCNICTTAS